MPVLDSKYCAIVAASLHQNRGIYPALGLFDDSVFGSGASVSIRVRVPE